MVRYISDKCKYICEVGKANKVDEGRAAFKENLGSVLLSKFPHPEKAISAISLNEPKIIVVKYIKQNS